MTRPSPSDSSLKALVITAGTLRPDFHKTETDYTLYVDANTSSVQIYPKAMDDKANVTTSPVSFDILNPGDTCGQCIVQSLDKSTTTTYNLTIRKGKLWLMLLGTLVYL